MKNIHKGTEKEENPYKKKRGHQVGYVNNI